MGGPLAALALLAAAGCTGSQRKELARVPFAPGDEVRFIPVQTKAIAITYDDGPNGTYTEAILNMLKASDAKATFFLVGKNVERDPAIARRIVADGHDVGNHSFSHKSYTNMPAEEVREDIDRTTRAIEAATGVRPRYLRPSFGSVTRELPAICRDRQYLMVGWSSDGSDWNRHTSAEIAMTILTRLQPGQIILLHDGHGTDMGFNEQRCVDATRAILDAIKYTGYEAVTISELIRRYRPSPQEIQFEEGVRFMGMEVIPGGVQPGEALWCNYFWYISAEAPRHPLNVAVHFDDGHHVAFQNDHGLNMGHLKSFEQKLTVPETVRPGSYTAKIALYPAERTPFHPRLRPQTRLPVARRMVTTPYALTVNERTSPP